VQNIVILHGNIVSCHLLCFVMLVNFYLNISLHG